jgi:hypothetical protein
MEPHSLLSHNILVYCDNASVFYLASNPILHQCTKHVEIELDFICDKITIREVQVLHIPTTSQFTDIFTKGLPTTGKQNLSLA